MSKLSKEELRAEAKKLFNRIKSFATIYDVEVYLVALFNKQKLEVTEEWIEEKAKEAWNLWWYKASGKYGTDFTGTIRFDFQGVKNLIRSLIKEIIKQ